MMDHNPSALRSWIEYIAAQYSRNHNCLVDSEKLFKEVIIEFPEGSNLDIQATWRPKNVLLVDDETIFNFLHTRILQLTRVTNEIQETLSGLEALEFLKSCSHNNRIPDIILLDLSMPVMDGFTFLDAFRQLDIPGKDQISIIVITSSIDQRDRLKAKEMGITHYLIKPVDERELCAAVISG